MSDSLSNAALAAQVVTMINKWNQREDQMVTWLAGTASGGPNGDGRYPLSNVLGVTSLVACPAKMAAMVADPIAGAEALLAEAQTILADITALAAAVDTKATQAAASATAAASSASQADASRIATASAETRIASTYPNITVSSSPPSGGNDGDVWFVYT